MSKEKIFKLENNLRIQQEGDEAILFNLKTDYIYEVSNDIIDFIKNFDGVLTTYQIIETKKNDFNLGPDQVNQLFTLVDELVSEKILAEIKS